MKKKLIIVESAAKVKTLSKILGNDYEVASCLGHVMDLPKSSLGVDVANGFIPTYVSTPRQKKIIKELKAKAKNAEVIYLATDPDREGEAIAAHLAAALNGNRVKRITFNEITAEAVRAALASPRQVDERLVASQQARRILDRLVGYEVSPILWKKVTRGLSAGRVQSVAVRLICEREEEIENFVPVEYWTIEGTFATAAGEEFGANLVAIAGETLMGPGKLEGYGRRLGTEDEARRERDRAAAQEYVVKEFEQKTRRRAPAPPFTTSTLQQAANRRFGFTGTKTMAIAQELYEGVDIDGDRVGLITYMRTDSVRVAETAIASARHYIQNKFGEEYLPEQPRYYKSRRGAQEAHEAIRPTAVERAPEKVVPFLTPDQAKLYELIYNHFLASQMADAVYDVETATLVGGDYEFRAAAQKLKFPGFLVAFPSEEGKDTHLPTLAPGEAVRVIAMEAAQHFTEPPPRYNDASLVKALEEHGIGRPSTYAPIIQTIIARRYVERRRRAFYPTELGKLVNALLVAAFPDIFNVAFTAHVEEELDEIEEGRAEWSEVLREFYEPFSKDVAAAGEVMDAVRDNAAEPTDVRCPTCGAPMEVRWGRFGKYLRCSSYPDCKTTANLARDETGRAVAVTSEPTGEVCEKCGGAMVVKTGRYGEFLACENYPRCKNAKPLVKKTDATCPKCGGAIVQRRGRRGNTFYGCENYPACDFTANAEVINRSCPKCGSPYLLKKDDGASCPAKGCDYKEE